MIKADVLYIGYPRSGSTYLRAYFRSHPQMNYDDQQIAELLYQPAYKPDLIDKPNGKVYISCDESIAESVCITGNPALWSKFLYQPGCFNLVRYDLVIDPREAARRMKAVHPNAKVMMVIREQVSWFESLHKATVSSLPPNQRTFLDYWITPQGIAMRSAAYHDYTIKAWMALFSDVLVLRYERLMEPRTSLLLCRWLGVDHIPFPSKRVNESHAGVTRLHQWLPFLSRMPFSVKSALKPLARFVPGKHAAVLYDEDKQMIRELYEESNKRTEVLLRKLQKP
jgi:Sulfotransferase family